MKRFTLILAVSLLGSFAASAYDLVLTMRVDETNQKITDLLPTANTTSSEFIANGVFNEADSTYHFTALPEQALLISYQDMNGGMHSANVSSPRDSLTIYVPQMLLNDATTLKEITVTANKTVMTNDKIIVTPTSADKRISHDGTRLLENMNIASLNVSSLEGTVTTAGGEPVSTFIDFMPASRVDVANIRPEDVKRVEIYDFPTDPRFGGQPHVVNFIMLKYEYGGYSKVSADQFFVFNTADYGLYSKFSYKKMTYDAGVNFNYTNVKHSGTESQYEYIFPDETINLESRKVEPRHKNHGVSAFFRAKYKTEKAVISNTVGINHSKAPESENLIFNEFSSPNYLSGTDRSFSDNSNISASWEGNYQFFFDNDYAMVVRPNLSYSNFKTNTAFFYPESDVPQITNHVKENAWKGSIGADLSKSFGKHSLTASLATWFGNNDINYEGSAVSHQEGTDYNAAFSVEANFVFGKLRLSPTVRMIYFGQKINGDRIDKFFPKTYFPISFLFNNKSRLNLTYQYAQMHAGLQEKTDVVLIQNQIDAISGNSDVDVQHMHQLSLSYNYYPIDEFSLSAFANYSHDDDLLTFTYAPFRPEGSDRYYMLRTSLNAGTSNSWNYGVNLSSNLFNRALVLRARVSGTTDNINAPFSCSGTSVNYSFAATYRFKNFYIAANYRSKNKSYSANGISESRPYYNFMAGWGNNSLNLSVAAINPFTSSYKAFTTDYYLPDYRMHSVTLGTTYHRYFMLSVSYSFSYGKKIARGDEGYAPSGAGSQILQ